MAKNFKVPFTNKGYATTIYIPRFTKNVKGAQISKQIFRLLRKMSIPLVSRGRRLTVLSCWSSRLIILRSIRKISRPKIGISGSVLEIFRSVNMGLILDPTMIPLFLLVDTDKTYQYPRLTQILIQLVIRNISAAILEHKNPVLVVCSIRVLQTRVRGSGWHSWNLITYSHRFEVLARGFGACPNYATRL